MNDTPAEEVTIDVRIRQFVMLRDLIKNLDEEHKEKMKPYREALTDLETVLLKHLQDTKQNSAATDYGTVYRTVRKSASIQDGNAFMEFIIKNDLYYLLDKKANALAVADYIEQNGVAPPGVNFSQHHQVGVRRK